MFTRAFLISLITAAAAIPVYAQTDTPKVDTRQERQQERNNEEIVNFHMDCLVRRDCKVG